MYVQHNMLSGFLGALERNVQIIIFPINTNLVLSSGLSTDLADLPRKKSVKAQENKFFCYSLSDQRMPRHTISAIYMFLQIADKHNCLRQSARTLERH